MPPKNISKFISRAFSAASPELFRRQILTGIEDFNRKVRHECGAFFFLNAVRARFRPAHDVPCSR